MSSSSSTSSSSLAYIPVAFLPFYLDENDFNSLGQIPGQIESVSCKIKLLGPRISFDANATLSGVANTEHVSLGYTSVGFDLKFYSQNLQIKCDPKTPMVPNTADVMTDDNLIKKLYANDGTFSFSSCIPRSLELYFCEMRGDRTSVPEPPHSYTIDNMGEFRLDEHVERFLLRSAIGHEVVDYHYKPKNGYIGRQHLQYLPYVHMGNQTFGFLGNNNGLRNNSISMKAKINDHGMEFDHFSDITDKGYVNNSLQTTI